MQVAAVSASSNGIPRALRRSAVAAAAGVVLVLFVGHKLMWELPARDRPSGLLHVLSAVGFSYVALRCVELLRAGSEQTTQSVLWLDVVNYLFPFHMLAAGPIQSWSDFTAHHVAPSPLGRNGVLGAFERVVGGLFKKFVLARAIEIALLTGFRARWPYLLLEIQAYCVWIYLDFSAYSDIAVGAGRLLGVETPENFRHPFAARNIVEFWSRWHMSLSSFLRRNVFIPVQLSLTRRLGVSHALLATSVAFAVTFVLSGAWHGLSLRFLVWGALHAGALVICTLYGRFLAARLGRAGVAVYLANPVYRVAATILTFEFFAFSLAFIAHPLTAFLQ